MFLFIKTTEGGQQADQSTAGIVTAQAVQFPIFDIRLKRIAGVAAVRAHGVVVGIEQDGGFCGSKMPVLRPNIVSQNAGPFGFFLLRKKSTSRSAVLSSSLGKDGVAISLCSFSQLPNSSVPATGRWLQVHFRSIHEMYKRNESVPLLPLISSFNGFFLRIRPNNSRGQSPPFCMGGQKSVVQFWQNTAPMSWIFLQVAR